MYCHLLKNICTLKEKIEDPLVFKLNLFWWHKESKRILLLDRRSYLRKYLHVFLCPSL